IEFNVGINEMTQLNGVTFFPNPTPGKLSIFLSENLSGTTIQMYDVVGNLVTSSSMDGVLRTDMDISSLANGVYFARVQNVKGTFVQKIILNK
ncbi:MAG: T9SS type A sorting domain-containing protein, partial [Bacteroidetes bacterium]|nr:T9SS type A sorting domain-containing protein [Bacteroidota bacterium]